jgi:hypothetical protein
MLRLSLSNLVASATILDETTEDATYIVENVKSPQRPFKPWKTTSIATDQSFVVDFGGTTTIEAIGLIRTNFTTVVIQGNSVNSWGGTLPYAVTRTIARNPWNTRYQYGYRPVAFAYRYLRVAISPPQTPTDGASVYKLGGLWAGTLTSAPRDFAETYSINRIEPRMDVTPQSRAWNQRLTMGEPRVALKFKLDVISGAPPAKTDLLKDWLDLQRRMTDAQYFLALVEDNDPAQSYVVQASTEPDWQIGTGSIATQQLTLEEMLGP